MTRTQQTHQFGTPIAPEAFGVPSNTAVTYKKDGSVASILGELSWDYSAYAGSEGIRRLHFRDLADIRPGDDITAYCGTIGDAQLAMFHLLRECTDDYPAWSTAKGFLLTIRHISKFAYSRGKTLYEALQNTDDVIECARTIKSGVSLSRLHSILVHLDKLGPARTGLLLPLRELHIPLMKLIRARTKPSQQHPIIPSRILSTLIGYLEDELAAFEAVSDEFMEALRNFVRAPLAPAAEPSKALADYIEQFGGDVNRRVSAKVLAHISAVCELIILLFSGMRKKEALSLPWDCLEIEQNDSGPHFLIHGVTTKFNGGIPKGVWWVTSSFGARAIWCMKAISGVFHSECGNSGHLGDKEGKFLLFCRRSGSGRLYSADLSIGASDNWLRNFLAKIDLTIRKEDISELQFTDPAFVELNLPKFRVGKQWKLTRHQLRRSLTVYAHASGLVSFPSLKRQLKQLTQEMTRYYGKGSSYAVNILKEPDHVSREWNEEMPLAEYLAYASQVLFSDERLFGGHAAWANISAKKGRISPFDRETTLQRFRDGELAYRETPLGGCAKSGSCDKNPFEWVSIKCLTKDCKHQIVKRSKLEKAISTQQKVVDDLRTKKSNPVELKMEANLLEELMAAERKYS